jgi:hypothetical protein
VQTLAAQTFAALFLAHVMADYLLQSTWLVVNKRRPIALAIHIGFVFVTMVALTGLISPWFILLAALHLGIDILKTFAMPDGLGSYLTDQALHILSIILIAWLAPGLWAMSPFESMDSLPLFYAVAAGVIFAARGGQFAIEHLLPENGAATVKGTVIGVLERSILAGSILSGVVWIALAVVGAKLAFGARVWRRASDLGRQRLIWGTTASFAWAVATALPLAIYVVSTL